MALLGLAFNVKMLAALICGPALLAGWLLAGTLDWRRRLAWMMAGGVTLAVVSLAWAVAFDLTPQGQPALCRQQPRQFHARADRGSQRAGTLRARATNDARTTAARARRRRVCKPTTPCPSGRLRLASPALAAQFAWTLPLAVLGAVFGWRRQRASVALWSTWALTYGIVFSAAGGIFHAYYLAALAPPLAALAGIGCFELWRRGPGHLAARTRGHRAWQGYITGASLGWDVTWIGFPLVALLAERGNAVARQAAACRHRRPRPAGPAGPVGAQRGVRAGQPHAAVVEPADAGSASTTAAARCCRAATGRSPTIPNCAPSCRTIAATRASCWPRPMRCLPRRSSSTAASPSWPSAASSAPTRC